MGKKEKFNTKKETWLYWNSSDVLTVKSSDVYVSSDESKESSANCDMIPKMNRHTNEHSKSEMTSLPASMCQFNRGPEYHGSLKNWFERCCYMMVNRPLVLNSGFIIFLISRYFENSALTSDQVYQLLL